MPYSSINQQNINNSNHGSLSIMDTYANAILRTFASLESPSLYTSQNNDQDHCLLSTLIDESLDNQFIETESSSLSSSSSSIYEDQLILEACLPLASNNTKQFQRLLSRLDQFYNKQQQMLTKTILPSSTDINDRYFFHSNESNKTKNKSNNLSPSSRKRYKFTSTNTDEIYNFSTNQSEHRAHSADSNRYHFSLNNSTQNERSRGSSEQRSMKLIDEPSNITSDTPYLFSKTTESLHYPSTTTTFIHPDDTWSYQRKYPQKISNINREYRQQKRMDTTTSTNGLLSILKPTDKSAVRSYLNEARERLSVKRSIQSPESLEKSVDRLVSSVNKKYRQQQQSQIPSTSTTTSLSYISQYYAKEEEPFNNDSIEYDNEQQRLYSSLNTNRIHTQIMKNVNKSLLDRNYQTDKNRFKNFEQNIRRYLRLYENQSLQRELNYNLIRCFSSSYLDDLRREEFRHNQTRNHIYSYTYEDIQDIYVPSILEAYKMKTSVDRERSHRLQSSLTTGQLSPTSSFGYSPIMIGSSNENMDTQLGTLETDLRSYASNSQTPANVRLSVDVFYEIMQESFRGIDAYIAGHVSNASQYTKQKSQQSQTKTRDYESDIDIKSNSSFWSDEDENYYIDDIHSRKIIPHQRKISRYLSTVNRSLLDRPSNLIADFYLSKLNRNMQASVRHVEIIARDKAYKHEIIDGIKTKLNRSLSAEHLYQVRKEHLRYKQPFHTPTSFTTEDVADIYKPSILENYKRKIAIELERRRRQRQGQFLSNLHSPPIYTSEIKPSHSPIIDRSNHDFHIVSPPTIIQTKEIVMGRARRSLTEDGSEHFVHYIGTTLPPPIYSDNKQSSSKNRITFTATIYDQYDLPYTTDVDSLDITDRKQMRIQQEKDSSNKITDDTLKTAKQVIASHPSVRMPHRSQTKIYPSNGTLTEQIAICHANLIETDNHYLSMVNIDQTVPLQQAEYLQISSNDLQHAMIITSPQPPFSLVEHSNSEQITQFIQQQPKYEHTTLIISNDEHIARIQNDIPIFETVPDINLSIPSSIITNVNEIFNDDEHSLYIPQINEQPLILNSSHINQLEQLYDIHVEENNIQFNEELNRQETISNNEEQLPEIEKTTVDMEVSYIASFIQLPVNHTFPVKNAQHKYPDVIEYEQVQISLPQQLTNKSFEIIDNNEQVTFLSDDSNLNQHQQQTNIHIDELPYLENPLCPTTIFTLNYAHHKQKQDKIFYKNDDQFSSISSFLDMEIFLNHFEESLDHEQHLPLIDQISLSYTASCTGQYERNKRSLPIEWFQPTILSYDEQLVEQWTVIKDIDTIQQEGTLRHQQLKLMTSNSDCANIPIITNTNIFCVEKNFEEENCNSSILIDEKDNIRIFDNISHYSSTSDYEIDSVDKDNDTATYLINGTVIIPTSLTNILPSSSITNTTALSQSSPLLTSSTAPIVPIVYFLDALAIEQTDTNNPTKEFLLTIGFGQNENNSRMNEITNIVSTIDQPSLPTWINRPSSSDNIIILPTIIHNENPSISSIEEQKLNFAIENQIDNDDTALLLPSHRIQHGYDLGENTQAPLKSFFEPSYLHLPIINEIYIYQMSFHNEFSLFHPPNILPHMLVSKTHDDEIILPNEYQIKQSKILSFARINDLLDKEESIQTILCTLNQPSYIEHCHIQPLYSFPETCFAEINQTEIINKNDINFLSDILTAFVKNKDDYELNQFDKIEPMQKITDDNQVKIKYGILDSLIATTTTTTTTATEAMVATVGGKTEKISCFSYKYSCNEIVETLELFIC
ncbi:unnamed protein product [Adineta steineri]|uniref:Uncharacterized protein n=1 Tax=Adineta steineri TaxID=433720 RepID=A0A814H705_9BILA|nr:unnamed protein product [Adineta steineri]CAF1230766.1 unnamed protein product [Adineta steineri]